MAELSYTERKITETFLQMSGGYVLNFSDRTFNAFVGDAVGIDIDQGKYRENGSSKANRLRTFIKLESDYTVGLLFTKLHEYLIAETNSTGNKVNEAQSEQFHKFAQRLSAGTIIEHIDAIQANNDDKDFHQLAKLINESIKNNEPEAALDRLHTFLIKFLKELCTSHGVEFAKDDTVNALFGKYIKVIRDKGFLESNMTQKIVKFTFQVMDAFNDVRNNNSFAHDNPILNYDESVLIFSNVTSTVKFIQALEAKHKNSAIVEAAPDWASF